MKSGKKPTRRQRLAIQAAGLTPENWLVMKIVGGMLYLVHRYANTQRQIPMEV